MRPLLAWAVSAAGLSAGAATWAQGGHMRGDAWGGDWMGGWMGSYGGPWLPVVLLVAVVALAVWIVKRK